ncbi:MAG: hypothetical protein MUP47_09185 [Phycisphaerae bacterium]|nr:hypothetical protein [Phycisphaerae bacterium]
MAAQTVLIVLLLAAPVATAVGFAIGGLLQVRRRDRLARAAHEAGLLFSAEDLFDVSRRYARFAVIGGGHGGRATNVTYGRLGGLPVRAFDFRYEIGHGTRRQGRHYAVVAVEAMEPATPLLLWRWGDLDLAPLAARQATERLGDWDCRGQGAAQAVAKLPEALAGAATGVEVLGPAELAGVRPAGSVEGDAAGTLLVWAPVRRERLYAVPLADALALAGALAGCQTDPAPPAQDDRTSPEC